MKRAVKYFLVQLKRFFKLTPAVILLSALLITALAAAMFGLYSSESEDGNNSFINIGIVGDVEDTYLRLAISTLQNLDSSRFSVSIHTVEDEETAAGMLRRGDLAAFVVFPDDYIIEAIRGNVQKIKCVTSDGAANLGTLMTGELMRTIAELVKNSQKAIHGFQSAAVDHGMGMSDAMKLGDRLAIEMIKVILRRDNMYAISETGTDGTGSMQSMLFCGFPVLVLMLWGITCCTVFSSRSSSLNGILASKGTGSAVQVLCEYAAYLVFMTTIIAVFAGIVFLVSPLLSLSDIFGQYEIQRLLPGMTVAVMTVSSMQFLIYEITRSAVSGALLQFFFAVSLGYISGCIYPSYYFPRGMQIFASYLPAWNCRIWLNGLMVNKPSPYTFAILTLYFASFLLLSVMIRRRRIKQGGSEI